MKKLKPNHFWNIIETKKIVRANGTNYTIRNNRNRFFFPDEWVAFNEQLRKKPKIAFNMLLNTGARIMEAQNIKVQDIDLGRNYILLRITKKVVRRIGKDKVGKAHPRTVSISSQFAKFLKKIIKEYNLKPEDTFPIPTTQACNQMMTRALKRAGIPDYQMFSLHNIRKTAEMWLLSLGIDSFKVVKRFGHSREIALKHYLSSDVFTFEEKNHIKEIVGDIYERMKN